MNPNNKIIVNTIILYAKIFIDMILALWTVPLVMRALGQSDYGLYNLVAGVVSMLTFLNGSMTVVTQRYMSVTMGKNNLKELNQVYNASIRIHIVLGIILVAMLEICSPLLFNGFLNIDTGRTGTAEIIYQFMIISTLFTIMAVPFDATLNAYENMLAFSLVSISEALLKLLLAFSLCIVSSDRLIVYGLGIAVISILGVLVRFTLVNNNYKDLKIRIKQAIPKPLYYSMLSYAGWNTFGSVAMMGKNQGIAIVLNLFKGTTINASYGIANQVNGLLSSFTSNIQKAISPQLMKNEGANNHNMMVEMSFSLVKIATIVFAIMAVPLVIEMNQVLTIWLHDDIPPYTVVFCQLIIIMQLLFQFTSGVALAIDAVGNIKQYRIVLSAVLVLNIPFAYLLMKMGYPPYYAIMSMIVVEGVCMLVRLYFARKTAGLPVKEYLTKCFYPLIFVIVLSLGGGYLLHLILPETIIRVFAVILATGIVTLCSAYKYVLNVKEKRVILSFLNDIRNRINNQM